MTAILGLHHLDGILMMADTEESLGRDAKSECDKLERFIFKLGNNIGIVLTGGAGDSHLIECANQELQRLFSAGIKQGAEVLQVLNDFAGSFFKRSIQGYKGFHPDYVPQFDMLIAVNIRPMTWLFKWHRDRVLLVPPLTHTSIGAGEAQIHPMLRDCQLSGLDEVVLFLGLRMMFYAKRQVVGVGQKTEAISLQNDGITHFWGTDTTAKIEALVSNLDRFLIQYLYTSLPHISATRISASAVLTARDVEKNVNKNLANLPRVMRMYRREYKKILTQSGARTSEDLR
jgi:hypothetical protein